MMSEKTELIVGIDAGNSKLSIAHTDQLMNHIIVPDMMDIRNIPNLVMFINDSDELRKFGNSATYGKSFHIPSISNEMNRTKVRLENQMSILTKTNVCIGKNSYDLPIFIIKNMIMSHVKKIIKMRYPDQINNQFYIVPSYSDSTCDMYFDALGAGCMLSTESKYNTSDISNKSIVHISDINSIILCYLNKYMYSRVERVLPKTNVLIIDIGHCKTNFILFEASKKKNNKILVQQKTTLIDKTISGCFIDDLLCEYVADKIEKSFNDSSITKCSKQKKSLNSSTLYNNKFFKSAIIRLKHQLSINNFVKFTFEEKDTDIMITINRSELEDLLKLNRIDKLLNDMIGTLLSITNRQIDYVELIGGTSRIPFLKNIIEKKLNPVSYTLNPDETVSCGASFYGYLLKNKNINQSLEFIREVRRSVAIQYENESNSTISVYPFEKFQSILSTFHLSHHDIEKRAKLHCNSDFSENIDTVIIRISSFSKTFKIIICDLTIDVDLMSKSKSKYIDVCLTYNMNDFVDILSIRDTDGNKIEFELNAYNNLNNIKKNNKNHNDETDFETYPIGNKLTCMYIPNENMFVEIEKLNDRRYDVINFIEGYYYDKDSVNKLMLNISNIDKIPNIKSTLHDTSDESFRNLKSPIKEVFEFYKFCEGYTKEPDTETEIKFNQYIKNTISNDYGLGKIEEAIDIIKNIKNKYKNLH